jgi:hypothetical protein
MIEKVKNPSNFVGQLLPTLVQFMKQIPFKLCNRYSKFDSTFQSIHNLTLKVLSVRNVDLSKQSYIGVISDHILRESRYQHTFLENFLYGYIYIYIYI